MRVIFPLKVIQIGSVNVTEHWRSNVSWSATCNRKFWKPTFSLKADIGKNFGCQIRNQREKMLSESGIRSRIYWKFEFSSFFTNCVHWSMQCGECFAPICAHVSRRHVHSVISSRAYVGSGAKHSPQSSQNAKSLRPKSRVKNLTWNFYFLTLSIISRTQYSKPRILILKHQASLNFSSKSVLAAT